jgi:hypothetical protein
MVMKQNLNLHGHFFDGSVSPDTTGNRFYNTQLAMSIDN